MQTITDLFIEYLYEIAQEDLSEEIAEKAQECLVDYLGAVYAGAYANKDKVSVLMENSSGRSKVLGMEKRTDAKTAAMINGFNAHTMELDDGHRFGMIHLGAVIISAILAVAEQEGSDYPGILRGIVVGYEAAARMAVAMQPGHKSIGFHTTGTCGAIGAAMGCAAMLKLGRPEMKTALSAAATSAAGLLEIQEGASELKAYNAAHAAMAGTAAAYIGRCGLCAPGDILAGGNRGMLAVHSTTVSEEKLFERKTYYEIERIYVKPYAACRHCHPAIEASISLRQKYNIPLEEIEQICIDTYKMAIKGHDHAKIQGVSSAKLSLPYSVAAGYILQSGGIDAFDVPAVGDRRILLLAQKVSIKENPQYTGLSPAKRVTEVSLVSKSGETVSCCIDYAKGDPENPMSRDEIFIKFRSLMEWCGQGAKADAYSALFSNKYIDSKSLFELL